DGLLADLEQFDVGHEDEALARFDELIGESAPAPAPSRAVARRKRRVHPNAATANATRVEAAIAARDAAGLPGLIADDAEFFEHSTGATHGQPGMLFTLRTLLKARDPSYRHESLATLGTSLALCRLSTSASGFVGRAFDVAAYDREDLLLI